MAYWSCLVLFSLCCFASDIVDLEPVGDSGTGPHSGTVITCSAITDNTAGTGCDSYAGCTWDLNTPACVKDPCFKWNQGDTIDDFTSSGTGVPSLPCAGTQAPTTPISGVTGHYPGLSVNPSSGGGCNAAGTSWSNGYPAQYSAGSGADYYSQRNGKAALDQCAYKYLANGTCNDVPWCVLTDAPLPAAGKVCKLLTECVTTYTGTNNVIRLPTNSVCSCLNARLQAGDTTACDQNPGCYVPTSGTNSGKCIVDPCYAFNIPDQENPTCTGATAPTGSTCSLATVFDQQGTNGQTSVSVCVATNGNATPNKCWKLQSATIKTATQGCPLNPRLSDDAYTESGTEGYCKGDCQIVSVPSYYYGWKKICVDADHLPDGATTVRVTSFVVIFIVAALLSMFSL